MYANYTKMQLIFFLAEFWHQLEEKQWHHPVQALPNRRAM
jgi:hypothetical protein